MSMMPKDRMFKGEATCTKAKCDDCGRWMRMKHIVYFKGRYLCSSCKLRGTPMPSFKSKPQILFQAILDKVHKPKTYINQKGYMFCTLSLPKCCCGKKFKLVEVKDAV